jgi:hypothetical protein
MELACIAAVEVVIAAEPGDRGMARSVGLVSGLIGLLAIFVDHGDLLNKGNEKQKSCNSARSAKPLVFFEFRE